MSPGPERTCVGCRRKVGRGALVRLAVREGRVVVDRRRLGGRGAWIHPRSGCLERALGRKAFARAFRGEAAVDAPSLSAQLTETGVQD